MVINVEIAGPSDAQPLVLVHGAGGSAATWFMQLRGLSKHFLVHAIELNGHGKSKDRAEPDTGQSYLDDISSIVNELDHPIVGGHSMGGALTQLFALQKSDSVRGIVLVGTGARLRVNPLIFEWLKTEFETYIQALGEFVFDKSADERLVQASMKEARRCSPHIISRDFAFCNEFDIMDRVQNIDCNTLILVGESDLMTPVKYSRYLAGKIPKAELHIISKAGHSVMLEQHEQVNNHILNWARELS